VNRPEYDEARRRIRALEGEPIPLVDAILAFAQATLAIAEAINRATKESR